jgi:tetratricopeptide (TPR) repeat protein
MLAQEAVSLYHKGDVTRAADKFEQAAGLDPYIAPIQLDLGFANLALYQANPRTSEGQAAAGKAVTAFERYLQLRPDEERARVFLVQTFVDTGRYDDAVAFFKPQVEKDPPDGEAIGTLGVIAAKTGRYEDAKTWYEKRIQIQPRNHDARLAYGVLLWDYLHAHTELVGPDRIALCDVAIKELGEAITIRPKSPNAYIYTNLVYRERALGEPDEDHKRSDLEEATKFYKQAQDLQKGEK